MWRQTPSYFGVALSMASAVMVTFAISNVAAYAATISFKKTPSRVKFTPRNSNPDLLFFFKCLCCLSLWWGDDGLFIPQVPLARTWCASWDKKEILIFHCKDNTNDRSGLTDLCCNRYIITKTVSLLLFCRRRPVVASFFKLK